MKEHSPASKQTVHSQGDARRPGSRAAMAKVPEPATRVSAVPVDILQAFGPAPEAPSVQRASALPRWLPSQEDPGQVHEAAVRGTIGAGTALPYLDQIQRAFGRHDVSGVRAYTGAAATEAAQSMGAAAYATGHRVAFAGTPSLHTAAHEAAHTVQQRGGVQLEGGVGQVGDPYEKHADAVANAVVSGRSAEALLDSAPRGGSAPMGQTPKVQKITQGAAKKAAAAQFAIRTLSTVESANMEIELEEKVKAAGKWDDKEYSVWKQKVVKEMSEEDFKTWIDSVKDKVLVKKKPSLIAKQAKATAKDKEAYEDAIVVPQGFYYVIDSESKAKSLYTTGAGPCSAVALYTKCKDSKKEVYAVAHIDAANEVENFVKAMIAAVKAKAGGEIGPIEGVVSTMNANESGLAEVAKEDASTFKGQPALEQNTYKFVIPLLRKHGVVISAIGAAGEVWMGKGYVKGAGSGASGNGVKAMPVDSLDRMVKTAESVTGIIMQIEAGLEMQKEQKASGISISSEDRLGKSPRTGINRLMNQVNEDVEKLEKKKDENLGTLKAFIKKNKAEIEKTPEGEILVKWAA